MKNDSLYNYGMTACVFSKKSFEDTGEKWHRGGFNFRYYKNESPSTYIPEKDVPY